MFGLLLRISADSDKTVFMPRVVQVITVYLGIVVRIFVMAVTLYSFTANA